MKMKKSHLVMLRGVTGFSSQCMWFLVEQIGVLNRVAPNVCSKGTVSLHSDSFTKQDAAKYHPGHPADILR